MKIWLGIEKKKEGKWTILNDLKLYSLLSDCYIILFSNHYAWFGSLILLLFLFFAKKKIDVLQTIWFYFQRMQIKYGKFL